MINHLQLIVHLKRILYIYLNSLRLTNLNELKKGSKVNLEGGLKDGKRNSGHIVEGHVDCTGEIIEKYPEGDSLWIRIKCDNKNVMKQIVHKCFIALDGTSLTVCDVTDNTFTVMLISHTQKCIIIPLKSIGDKVNIETDVTGKYICNYLSNINDRIENIEKCLNSKLDDLEKRIKNIENNNKH